MEVALMVAFVIAAIVVVVALDLLGIGWAVRKVWRALHRRGPHPGP